MIVVAITKPTIMTDVYNRDAVRLMVDNSASPAFVWSTIMGSRRLLTMTVAFEPFEIIDGKVPEGSIVTRSPASEDLVFLTFDLEALYRFVTTPSGKVNTTLRDLYRNLVTLLKSYCPELVKSCRQHANGYLITQ